MDSSTESNSEHHDYKISIFQKNGKEKTIYSVSGWKKNFTREEMNYFLYHINNHIQTKMSGF